MGAQIPGVKLNVAYANNDCGLGSLHIDPEGNHFRFLQAEGAVTKQLLYTVDQELFQIDDLIDEAVEPAANEGKAGCITQVTLADNEFVWAFVGPGYFTGTADGGGVAADALCYASTTAGAIGTTAVGLILRGITAQSAVTASQTGTFVASLPIHAVDSEPIS